MHLISKSCLLVVWEHHPSTLWNWVQESERRGFVALFEDHHGFSEFEYEQLLEVVDLCQVILKELLQQV